MEWINEVMPLLAAFGGGNAIAYIFNRRIMKKKLEAQSDSAKADAVGKNINNEKSVIEIYRKLVEDIEIHLGRRIEELEQKVNSMEAKISEMHNEKKGLERENFILKSIIETVKECKNTDCPVIKEKDKWLL